MMKRLGKVFIDANMINYAVAYNRDNVFDWINGLYEEIYIHQAVLDELLLNQNVAQGYIDTGKWLLFDPDDEECVSDESLAIYEQYEQQVKDGFKRLKQKKLEQNKNVKNTSDIGEIHSLAAAIFISATIMCSNDYDIKEVIANEKLAVSPTEGEDLQLIIQDTVEDFCFLCAQHGIATKGEVRRFFKFAVTKEDPVQRKKPEEVAKRKRKIESLDQRLAELTD